MDHTTPSSVGLVGGGIASFRAAETLRELGYDGRLYLVGDEPHAPYDRPPLSKDALVGAEARTQLLTEERAAELDVELVLGDAAASLDLAGCRLELASGARVEVDRVLLATGGRARALPVLGGDLPGVTGLRTLEDAERVRGLLATGGPVVVVGGGFVGLEVAASARTLGCDVTVVEAADRLLARVLPAEAAEEVAAVHRANGVVLELGAGITEVRGDDRVREVVLADGRRLPASCVVVGIGMVPADELAREAGLAVGDGVLTDAGGTTSHPHVLAAGDVARSPDPWYGGRVRVEQWQSAQSQGVAAACTMLGQEPAAPPVPWFWSDQGDLRLQVAGVPRVGTQVVERVGAGRTWFHLDSEDRMVGAVAVQRVKDVRGAMALIEAGVVLDRDELADPTKDLRRMARSLTAAASAG